MTTGADPLSAAMSSKIDEALSWWSKARSSAQKCMSSGTGPGAQNLKNTMVQQVEKLLAVQMKLEHLKVLGHGAPSEVKAALTHMGQGLVELQETLRALSAMG